jgi:hypothetical protein
VGEERVKERNGHRLFFFSLSKNRKRSSIAIPLIVHVILRQRDIETQWREKRQRG